ncbi:MAG: hypothetical protein QME60_02385 [Verrucomicrobiota bacterium]|nr:hypothetical protein [Verrucomicrobiota bacterium]
MELLIAISFRLAAILAIAGNPWLVARALVPRAGLPKTIAWAGIAAMLLNSAGILLLHVVKIPVTDLCLAVFHLALSLLLAAIVICRRLPFFPAMEFAHAVPLLLAAAFAIVALPFTFLAGNDTHKWQDLAASVAVEQKIAWLLHPLSLFGFTPGAYPVVQPLLLAGVQILGGAGVDWGFYVVSLVGGITGLFAAYALANRVFVRPTVAAWCAFFYVFSPVFLRYNHWATGRGLFLAVFPLFLLCAISAPRLASRAAAVLLGLLLTLTHKTGWIAVSIVLLAVLLARLLPRRRPRFVTALLLLIALVAGVGLSAPSFMPPALGSLAAYVHDSGARFAWMLPFALLGAVLFAGHLDKAPWRFVVCGLVLTLPIAGGEMYGAMIALAFVTIAATAGFTWLALTMPRYRLVLRSVMVALTVLQAAAVIGHRSATATPRRIREAARFLEARDPHGPLAVVAPESGAARQQLQAYLSGAPRFETVSNPTLGVGLRSPPPWRQSPRRLAAQWLAYFRNPFDWRGVENLQHGKSRRVYYVTVDGQGQRPDAAAPIYDSAGVAIYDTPLSAPPGSRQETTTP